MTTFASTKDDTGDCREAARLESLLSYEVLDTPAEPAFDSIARWAARLCDTPVGAITFIDEHRQWFKAAVGIALEQAPRATAFCNLTIQGYDPVVIEDASTDPRFAANPLVVQTPELVFYAGVPLTVEGGHNLGTLAVLDHQPRRISPGAFDDLRALAAQTVVLLEERRLRRRAETLAHKRGERADALMRMAMQAAHLGAWEADLATRRVTWSDGMAEVHGQPPGYSPSIEQALDFYSEPYRSRLAQAYEHCVREGIPFDLELLAKPLPNGDSRWMRAIGEAVRDERGRTTSLRGACQDVTERHLATEQLRLLDACVRHLNEVVMITTPEVDPPGPRIVFVNEAIERMCGIRPDELIGQTPRILQGPQTQRDRLDEIRDAVRHCREHEVELINYRRDGTPYWVELKLTPVDNGNGACTHFVSVGRDITRRKQAEQQRDAFEEQLRQAQKIESIGTLAGGIAHDFNNILGTVLSHVAMSLDLLPQESPVWRHLLHIRSASERARSLVQQILAFGRKQTIDRVEQLVAPLIESTAELLHATLPAAIRLDTQITSRPLLSTIDANQLQQVLLNLCTNAWHAMQQDGGHITLGVEPVHVDRQHGHPAGVPASLAPGCHAHLWVADNGCGMDASTRERIFEPFFTTKPTGKGTGLGLSAAHGIVAAHGGTITVDSAPGAGSVFHVYLPARLDHHAAEQDAEPPPLAALQAGTLRVMCVDDDEVLLLTQSALLQKAGCQVSGHHEPGEALKDLARDRSAVDVLVTDFSMPTMNGLELARRARRLAPALPIVIVSGFITDELLVQAQALDIAAFVRKERLAEDLVPAVLAPRMPPAA